MLCLGYRLLQVGGYGLHISCQVSLVLLKVNEL